MDEPAGGPGGLGVLVDNAGTGTARPVIDMDYQEWRSVLALELSRYGITGPQAAGSLTSERWRELG